MIHRIHIPSLVAVRVELPTTLVLTYAGSQVRRFDCTPYLERGVFTRLKIPALMAQAHLAHGTVCWPGDLDIAPETLYLRSVEATQSAPSTSPTTT